MSNSSHTYSVNGTGFNSFFAAIAHAKELGAEVIENATGNRRWAPAPKKAVSKVRHVIIMPDGTEKEFGRVRR